MNGAVAGGDARRILFSAATSDGMLFDLTWCIIGLAFATVWVLATEVLVYDRRHESRRWCSPW
jgi:hypothetical protein